MKGRFSLRVLLTLALALFGSSVLAQETTSGSIEGTVVDSTGQPLPGVTVTVTATQGTKSATSDSNGGFRFGFLTPGTYELSSALQGFITVEQKNIIVGLGSRVRVELTMTSGVSETITVVGSAPVVDLTSTTSGATISSDLMQNIPIGRTFADTLALAPGVVDSGIDNSNPSISGASGLENAYVVDGVNIGNTGYGSAGSYSIVFGSLGTGVNFDYIQEVQVKTGGYEPEFGEALGGFVNLVTKSGGNTLDGSGFAYWQPAALEGDRNEFELEQVVPSVDNSSFELDQYDVGLDVGGPLAKDKAFFYGAFNPSYETLERRTYHVLREHTGVDHTLERKRKIYNYAGNMKWFLNPQHTLSFSAFGDPSTGDAGAQRASSLAVPNPEDRFSELKYGGNNLIGRWNGEIMSNWFVEGSVAWHRDKFEETFSRNLPNGSDRRSTPFIPLGGVGFFDQAESKNAQYRLKLSNFFEAGGEHNLRYGIEYQDITYNSTANYSGPSGIELVLGAGTPDERRVISTSGFIHQIRRTQFRVPRIRSSELTANTNAEYLAFYGSDSWNITKYLNVMAGVRWERDKLNGSVEDFTWSDNWAPRFHVTWDPTQDNKTKVGFSWGRFYGKIPNDLAVRALSTEVTHFLIYDINDVDVSDPNNPQFSGQIPIFDLTFGDHPTVVVEDSKITQQDEFVGSLEREILPFFNLGVTVLYRKLNRTLEDYAIVPYSQLVAGTADFGEYVIGNPDLDHPDLFPKPARKYTSVTLRADKRLQNSWQMLASYTWSRLKGNYEGFFRRDNGQSDPFITSLFDFPYLADPDVWEHTIADGVLPNDRTHVFNLNGSYQFANKMNLGVGVRIQSGLPITKLGFNEAYGNGGEIPLEERGSEGRGDTVPTFNFNFRYPLQLGGGELNLIVDVFNLFNTQKGISYEQDFETGCAGPGCENDDFGRIVEFQDPRQIRFAARYSFR